MALDTSIALGVKNPQFQTIDPMTVYNAMQEQQYNALRGRALEQQMAQNALAMQNTMEDRRAAAAQAAQARRQADELRRMIQGGVIPAKNAMMGPGTIQGSTPAGYDFEGVKNRLIGAGNVSGFEAMSKLQQQEADRLKSQLAVETERRTGGKIQAETEGLDLKNIDTRLTTIKSLAPMIDTPEGAASFSKLITQIVPEFSSVAGDPDAAAMRNAEAFSKDPNAWRTQVSNLTAEQLVQARERATAPMKYSVQDTAQGIMRVPETGAGPAIPLTGPGGETLMPVDRRSVTNINTVDTASDTAMKEYVKDISEQRKMYASAPAVLENIEKAKSLIPDAKKFMGTGGEGLLEATKFFNNRIGTEINAKGVSSAEELRSRLFMGVMDNLKKMDSQPTQQQQVALQEAVGKLGTDPNALPQVLDIMADSLRTKIGIYNTDVTEAEKRGVKFPYKPQIELPPKSSGASAGGGTSVTTPDGKVFSFPTPEAAAQFKKAAGIP
jgi:hypothetical protein